MIKINMAIREHLDVFILQFQLHFFFVFTFLMYRIFYLLPVKHPSVSGGGFLTHASSFAANLCQRSVQVDEIIMPLWSEFP